MARHVCGGIQNAGSFLLCGLMVVTAVGCSGGVGTDALGNQVVGQSVPSSSVSSSSGSDSSSTSSSESSSSDSSSSSSGFSSSSSSSSESSSSSSSSQSSSSSSSAGTGNVSLQWTEPKTNTNGTALTDLEGYTIQYGTSASHLTEAVNIDSPATTSYIVQDLAVGTWYFAISAYASDGTQSSLSNVVSTQVQ
jgi:hypothetical protein